jgi:drug/metabolite transporter (DMT)-like permease
MKSFLSRRWRLLLAWTLPTACAVGCILSPLRGYGAVSRVVAQKIPLGSPLHISVVYTWSAILVIVVASVVGDVLLARAMKQVGDVGELRRRVGIFAVIGRTLGNPNFLLGVTAMAVAFFSLLFALSWGDVSLVAPAASMSNNGGRCSVLLLQKAPDDYRGFCVLRWAMAARVIPD